MKSQKRRRIENKTDYGKRAKMLQSKRERLVFRKTNRYVIAQCVTSENAQDRIIVGVTSKDLLKYGWPKNFEGSLKSIPASYLTGLLIGKKIVEKKMDPIVDLGMHRVLHKTKIYAFLKGIKDAGLNVTEKENLFPEETRIRGQNLKEDFSKHFDVIKSKIMKE